MGDMTHNENRADLRYGLRDVEGWVCRHRICLTARCGRCAEVLAMTDPETPEPPKGWKYHMIRASSFSPMSCGLVYEPDDDSFSDDGLGMENVRAKLDEIIREYNNHTYPTTQGPIEPPMALVLPKAAPRENYGWLGTVPEMKEWSGGLTDLRLRTRGSCYANEYVLVGSHDQGDGWRALYLAGEDLLEGDDVRINLTDGKLYRATSAVMFTAGHCEHGRPYSSRCEDCLADEAPLDDLPEVIEEPDLHDFFPYLMRHADGSITGFFDREAARKALIVLEQGGASLELAPDREGVTLIKVIKHGAVIAVLTKGANS